MPLRLAQQRMTLSDLEWPFHCSSVPSVWEGRANVNALCTLSTLKSTSSESRAISAVAELLVILSSNVWCGCGLGFSLKALSLALGYLALITSLVHSVVH